MQAWNMLRTMVSIHLRVLFRSPQALFFNLLMPLVFLALLGYVFGRENTAIRIGLAAGGGPRAEHVRAAFARSPLFDVREGPAADLERALRKGELSAVILVPEPPGGGDGQPLAVEVLYDATSPQRGEAARATVEQTLAALNQRLSGVPPSLVAIVRPVQTQRMRYTDHLLAGILAFMILNAGAYGLLVNIARARESGILRHQFATPLPTWVWVMARILVTYALALVQTATVLLVGRWWYGTTLEGSVLNLAVMVGLGNLAMLGIGMLAGAFVRSAEAAQPVAVILSNVSAFLGDVWIPLNLAPDWLQTVARLIPATYLSHGLRQIMLAGESLSALGRDVAVLALWAAVTIALATWRLHQLRRPA